MAYIQHECMLIGTKRYVWECSYQHYMLILYADFMIMKKTEGIQMSINVGINIIEQHIRKK